MKAEINTDDKLSKKVNSQRNLKGIRSKDKKDIHVKVKIKNNTDDTSDMEIMEIMREIKRALIRINHLHNERVSFKIKNCDFEKYISQGRRMSMKGCKTIAEYTIRKWMEDNGFVTELFKLEVVGTVGIITDMKGETMQVEYIPATMQVREVKEPEERELIKNKKEEINEREEQKR